MFEYTKKGWNGELTFSEIILGKYLDLEGAVIMIAYVGFYVTLLMVAKAPSWESAWLYIFLIYGLLFYVWLLRAFWGSSNYAKTKTRANLIRAFTLLLPIISLLFFVFIIIYSIITALLDAFS